MRERVTAAYCQLASTEDVPGKASPGPPIVLVEIVEAADSLAKLNEAGSGKEIGPEIVIFLESTGEVVAHAEGKGQPVGDLPVVAKVEANGLAINMTVCVTEVAGSKIGSAEQKLLKHGAILSKVPASVGGAVRAGGVAALGEAGARRGYASCWCKRPGSCLQFSWCGCP